LARFTVAPELFEISPRPCLAVVVAEGVRGSASDPAIASLLRDEALSFAASHEGQDVREHPHVVVWREAFRAVGVNPARFPSSVEALARRVQKRSEIASINAVVDLVNVLSLRHVLSMGAHDLDTLPGDIELRLARPDDRFVPLGGGAPETPDPGEIVYATGSVVRTRKWTWRQGEVAKVTPASRRIFFPIDAFEAVTDEAARTAGEELAASLARFLGATTSVAWVDRDQPACELGAG
jgi:DNA/RNA-binding domain of Phe-tRNA-synthetase-like protein